MATAPWGGTRKKGAEYDMTAIMAHIDQRFENLERRSGGGHSSRAVQLYRAGHIDGRFDFADAIDTGGIMLTGALGGLFISAGASVLFGTEIAPVWAATAVGTGAISFTRIIADLTWPAIRSLPWLVRAWQVRDDWPDYCKWRDGDGYDGDDTTGDIIRLMKYDGPDFVDAPQSAPARRFRLNNGETLPLSELRTFLVRSFVSGDWTRSAWCGGDGKPGRGMPQWQWTAIRDTLAEHPVWQTADRPTLDGFLARLGEA